MMRVALSLGTDPLNASVVHGLHHILGCLFDPVELIKDLILVGYARGHVADFPNNLLAVAHKLSFPGELAGFIAPEVIISASCGVDLTFVEMVRMSASLKEVLPWLVNLCQWALVASIVIIEVSKRWVFLWNYEVLWLHI
jgi:hypothetical protein